MRIKKGIKKEYLILLSIILLSCSLQVFITFRNPIPDQDEAVHFNLAQNIVKNGLPIRNRGEGEIFFNHPFLSFYLMALPLFFSRSLFGARLLGTVLSILIILGTYFIGKKIGGLLAGLIAAFLLAAHPLFLTFAHSLHIEVYLGFFILVSISLFLLAEERKKSGLYLFSGLTLGLALLTKYLAIALFFSYLVFFLCQRKRKKLLEMRLILVLLPATLLFIFWPIFGYLVDWTGFLDSFGVWFTYGKDNLHDPRVSVSWFRHFFALGLALSPPFALASFFAFVSLGVDYFTGKQRVGSYGFLLIFVAFWFAMLLLLSVKDIKYLFSILPWLAIILAWRVKNLKLNYKGIILALAFLALFSPIDFLNLRETALNNRLYFSLYMWQIDRESLGRENEGCSQLGYIKSISKQDEVILFDRGEAFAGFCAQRPYHSFVYFQYKEAVSMVDEAKIVVVSQDLFLPYLSAEERARFLVKLENEFFLAKTVPVWGRIMVRK